MSGDQVIYTKDREGPHPAKINRNMTIDAKIIPDTIDTMEFARMIGAPSDLPNEIGNGIVIRFDNTIPVREVGIKRANENGQDPTPTLKRYLRECIELTNECNGQQGRYVGEITQDYVDKGITYFIKDTSGHVEVGLNDDGTIERSGLVTRPGVSKYGVLEEYFQASTGIFWDNGSPNSPLIRIVGDVSNPEIVPRGKTYAYLIKRLPHLFKLSIEQKNPVTATQSYVSPTTRPYGMPKEWNQEPENQDPNKNHSAGYEQGSGRESIKRREHKLK